LWSVLLVNEQVFCPCLVKMEIRVQVQPLSFPIKGLLHNPTLDDGSTLAACSNCHENRFLLVGVMPMYR
jgi:hypothetical protein